MWRKDWHMPNCTRTGLKISGNRSDGAINPNVTFLIQFSSICTEEVQQWVSKTIFKTQRRLCDGFGSWQNWWNFGRKKFTIKFRTTMQNHLESIQIKALVVLQEVWRTIAKDYLKKFLESLSKRVQVVPNINFQSCFCLISKFAPISIFFAKYKSKVCELSKCFIPKITMQWFFCFLAPP